MKPVSNQLLLEKVGAYLDLNWISRNDSAVIHKADLGEKLDSDVQLKDSVLPKHSLLLELKAYAEMGYQKGVNNILDQIETEQLLSEESFSYLQQLSHAFQFEKLAQHIEANSA